MSAALGAVPAIAFDGMQAAGCNADCALHPTKPVKFLDLLNKPVRFRRRSTASDSTDREIDQAAIAAAASKAAAAPAPQRGTSTAAHVNPAASPASLVPSVAPPSAENFITLLSQRMDEAALLFATDQPEAAARLLDTLLVTPLPYATDTERRAWWMLLELHEAQGQQDGFDRTALAYAQRFEASPPQWPSRSAAPQMIAREPQAAAPLVLRLRDRLDASAQAVMTQWQQCSATVTELTLELAPVNAVDLAGCHLLLAVLADWQQRGMQVDLRPCAAMLTMLRELIQSGRRDEDDAGWRLLIELLRLAGDVERYEDACLAYSLTYEMSPPAAPPPVISDRSPYSADPRSAATQATHRHPAKPGAVTSAAFPLPEIITFPIDPLLVPLRAHVRQSGANMPSLVLDANRLQRIDFHAAGPLQSSLAELVAGKPVEWQGVSFLVSTLLQLTSSSAMPGIINRKP